MKRQRFGTAWAVWLAVVVFGFAVIEGLAIADGVDGGTLSEWTWHYLSYPAFSVPFFIVFTGGLIWLWLHFFRKYRP